MQLKDQLVQKLFRKECTKVELELFFDLLKEDDSNTGPNAMLELFKQLEEIPELEDSSAKRILARIEQKIESDSSQPKTKRKWLKKRFGMLQAIAAVLLLVIMCWFTIIWLQPDNIIIQSASNEIKKITLPDGSLVTLNENSKLLYVSSWDSKKNRVVTLKGEAYFQVKKGLKNKFQVITNDLTVEVLGTVFNVNTRQQATKVFLEEGEVVLKLKDKVGAELHLEPGQEASFSQANQALELPKKIEDDSAVSWLSGIQIFKDVALDEIFNKLSFIHEVQYKFEKAEWGEVKYNLALPYKNLEQSLQLIKQTTGFKIIHEDSTLYIQEKTDR